MASQAISPLSAYRQLLRATRIAFEGDVRTLLAARAEVRRNFDQNRRGGVDTPMKLQQALETAQVLRTNVVQGVRSGTTTGSTSAAVGEKGSGDSDGAAQGGEQEGEGKYTLRIHDEIERGDNDTIKGNKGAEPVKVKPCSAP